MIDLCESLSSLLRRMWRFLSEVPFMVSYDKRSVQNRSIVRIIGTILPLPPAPRVYFNLAAWNPELVRFTDGTGREIISLNHHETADYQKEINELRLELKAIKETLATIMEKESTLANLEKITKTGQMPVSSPVPPPVPPPIPPPPPMPEANFTSTKPPRFVKSKRTTRSPGGRPIKPNREYKIDPSDVLAQVLKRRYTVVQESSDAESFNGSFTEFTSPIKLIPA